MIIIDGDWGTQVGEAAVIAAAYALCRKIVRFSSWKKIIRISPRSSSISVHTPAKYYAIPANFSSPVRHIRP